MDRCYKSYSQASLAQTVLAKQRKCNCRIFSIHQWHDGEIPMLDDGRVDMEKWFDPNAHRPPGDWNNDGRIAPDTGEERGGVNYDFGLVTKTATSMTVTHATLMINPDKNNDGLGDFFPDQPIKWDSQIIESSYSEWKDIYADFNQEVWCVACQVDPASLGP